MKKQLIKTIKDYLGVGGCIGFEHGYIYPVINTNKMCMVSDMYIFISTSTKIPLTKLNINDLKSVYAALIAYENYVINLNNSLYND